MKTKKFKTIQNIKTTKGMILKMINITLSQTEVKQVVGKRKNKSNTFDGLYTLRSSHEEGFHTTAAATAAAVY